METLALYLKLRTHILVLCSQSGLIGDVLVGISSTHDGARVTTKCVACPAEGRIICEHSPAFATWVIAGVAQSLTVQSNH